MFVEKAFSPSPALAPMLHFSGDAAVALLPLRRRLRERSRHHLQDRCPVLRRLLRPDAVTRQQLVARARTCRGNVAERAVGRYNEGGHLLSQCLGAPPYAKRLEERLVELVLRLAVDDRVPVVRRERTRIDSGAPAARITLP